MVIDGFIMMGSAIIIELIFRFLDFEFSIIRGYLPAILGFIFIKLVLFFITGIYSVSLRTYGFNDAFKLLFIVILTNIVLITIARYSFITNIDLSIVIIYAVFYTISEMILLTFYRSIKRILDYYMFLQKRYVKNATRVIIIGSGVGGEMVARRINQNTASVPVLFLDDDEDRIGRSMLGIKIMGPIKDVKHYIQQYHIDEVVIAISSMTQKKLKELVEILTLENVSIKRLPTLQELNEGESYNIKPVEITDLLNRNEIELKNYGFESVVKDQIVLVTGGGGSIGSELCRQIAMSKPKELHVIDVYENSAYDLQMELLNFPKRYNHIKLDVHIASVSHYTHLETLIKKIQPNIIYHAAAHKHVPLMEKTPSEALRTNVIGTYNVAMLAALSKVSKFVLISSDKAVRPTNIMGASKRLAERIIQTIQSTTQTTTFSAVRFGNVLGSNGSVIPLFKSQIEKGGPVTVTDPKVTRYFMTIKESVSLILESTVYAKKGDIIVLDMGAPVKIIDLAERMIRLSGLQPYEDIPIEFIGLRPGEKLYEELLIKDNDFTHTTDNPKIFIESSKDELIDLNAIQNLNGSLDSIEKDAVIKILKSYVKDYSPFPKG